MCMLMCMRMLNRRVQVLFDKDLWINLTKLAESEGISIGEFLRKAAKEKIERKKELEHRKSVIDSILKHRPKPFKGKIDYKALINAGRRY